MILRLWELWLCEKNRGLLMTLSILNCSQDSLGEAIGDTQLSFSQSRLIEIMDLT